MSRWLPIFAVAFGILLAGIGARLWFSLGGESPCEVYERVDFDALPTEPTCVRLRAQAHYDVVLKEHTPGNLFVSERTVHLFPLFEPDQLDERGIRVLVRAERAPERLVNVETMTIAGRLQPMTTADVPIGAEVQLGRSGGYFFEDLAMVMVADEIASDGDEVWRRPR